MRYKYFQITTFLILILAGCRTKETIKEILISDSSQVILGKSNWEGPSDASAQVILFRTEKGMGIDLKITDDQLFQNIKNPATSDAAELYFDFRPPRKKSINSYMKGVFQLIIRPGFITHTHEIIFFPHNYPTKVPHAEIICRKKNSGYCITVFFSFASLQEVHYLPLSSFGFDAAIIDADNDSSVTKMFWHSKNDLNWRNPGNFGSINLKDDE